MQSEGVSFDREACGFSVEGVSLLFVFTVAYFTEIMQKTFRNNSMLMSDQVKIPKCQSSDQQ